MDTAGIAIGTHRRRLSGKVCNLMGKEKTLIMPTRERRKAFEKKQP